MWLNPLSGLGGGFYFVLLLAWECKRSPISHKTIKVYLSAIHHHHVVSGLSFCGYSSRMYLVIQDVKRSNGVPQNSRLPITADVLRAIKRALQKDAHSFENVMLLGSL